MTDLACEICGDRVTQGSARYEAGVVHCKKCFRTEAAREHISGKLSSSSASSDRSSMTGDSVSDEGELEHSFLSVLLFNLGGIFLISSAVICVQLWPGDPGYGKSWPTLAYMPAIGWLAAGLVQCVLFVAAGQGLHYLRQIAANTKGLNKPTQPTDNP